MSTRLTLIITFLITSFLLAQNPPPNKNFNPSFSGGFALGYNGGIGGQLSGTVSDFVNDFPLSARFGIGYTSTNPGDPDAARKIFINDATNGVPEKSGKVWDFRLDFLVPVQLFSLPKSFVYAGIRYSEFTADFNFVDGNEFFNIWSNQWGLGGGVETHLGLGYRLALIFSGGAEYYFSNTIEGHDTAYSTDGQNINPREGFSYNDADNAINQPKIVGRFMLGINYAF
jgi:hypothetical protein